MVLLKRVYEPPAPADGTRVLVDRLWPRGLARQGAQIDAWLRDIAPSDGLRKWFGHAPDRWEEFARRYRAELAAPGAAASLDRLRRYASAGTVTLLYAARDQSRNNAVVIAEVLES